MSNNACHRSDRTDMVAREMNDAAAAASRCEDQRVVTCATLKSD